jgi:hypothetical protein
MTDMNKQQFLKFLIGEIERQQKDMYKSGEGKKLITVLTEIYTLVSDGKFDVYSRDIAGEIRDVHNSHGNLKTGIVNHAH